MKILRSVNKLSLVKGPVVLAAGTFDGLHLGHQALIQRAIKEATRTEGTAVVLTFDRHPALITRPEKAPALLTSNESKLALIEQLGVSVVLLLEFNPALASIPAEDFIRKLAAAAHHLHEICVGSEWSFGSGGIGNIALLKKLGEELGFSVARIHPIEIGGMPISSTRIRQAISLGNFGESAACLGRNYVLRGRVASGDGIGSKIGFPTANLAIEGLQLPPDGVYAVRVQREKEIYHGVANIGFRPTVKDALNTGRTMEIHLFEFSENLVGETLAVEFVQFLRGEKKFPDLDQLVAQIKLDCATAKKSFKMHGVNATQVL